MAEPLPDEIIPVPVQIRNETAKAWCFRVLGVEGFRRDSWIAKSQTTFERVEELCIAPNGSTIITAGHMMLPRRYAHALGYKEPIDGN